MVLENLVRKNLVPKTESGTTRLPKGGLCADVKNL